MIQSRAVPELQPVGVTPRESTLIVMGLALLAVSAQEETVIKSQAVPAVPVAEAICHR